MTVHPSHNRGDWEDVCDKNSGNTSTRTLSAAPLTSTNTVEATSPTGGSTSTTRAPVSESAEDRSTNTFAYPSDPSAHASPSRGPIREALNAMGHGDVVRECEARYLSSLERCHGTVSDIAAGGAEEHGEDPAPALIVDAVMCNPPFYDLEEEVGNTRILGRYAGITYTWMNVTWGKVETSHYLRKAIAYSGSDRDRNRRPAILCTMFT